MSILAIHNAGTYPRGAWHGLSLDSSPCFALEAWTYTWKQIPILAKPWGEDGGYAPPSEGRRDAGLWRPEEAIRSLSWPFRWAFPSNLPLSQALNSTAPGSKGSLFFPEYREGMKRWHNARPGGWPGPVLLNLELHQNHLAACKHSSPGPSPRVSGSGGLEHENLEL